MKRLLSLVLLLTLTSSCRLGWPGFLATKTPYEAPSKAKGEVAPPGCKAVHIEGLFRHGSRFLSKPREIDRLLAIMESAHSKSALTAKGLTVLSWLQETKRMFQPGMLTKQGESELYNLGLRMGENFAELFALPAYVEMTSASKDRVMKSLEQFKQGLLSTTNVKIKVSEGDDRILRYFDHCHSYQKYKNSQMRALIEKAVSPISNRSQRKVTNSLFVTLDDKDRAKVVDSLYALCQQDYNLDRQTSEQRFCSLLPEKLKEAESEKTNIKSYFKMGPATDNGMACAVLEPMFGRMEASTQSKPVSIANMAFAHAETVVPVSDFFELFSPDLDEWKASKAGPMGANVQLITYECVEREIKTFKVKLLYNEKERYFSTPACKNSVYCDWEAVHAYYQKRKHDLGMKSCSEADWNQRCANQALSEYVTKEVE
jgi:multiple inositol-polyphosphate phosphatase/2,3-bisphosphoglycerate 3-phosphatase